jgi:glutamate-ammonia-ligase adenylyltransferase
VTATVPAVLEAQIERSADPPAVRTALATLADAGRVTRLVDDPALSAVAVAVVAASRSLTRVLLLEPAALDVLAALDRRPPVDADRLVRWKALEYLRIAARDLAGLDDLPATGRLLADLADDVLEAAVDGIDDLAVIAMGKAGARELNYASDVDVMFVGSGDPRPAMARARQCFRVDADLRPEGRNGPLARSLASYEAYWDGWAETWEFQALLKARPAAGAAELGAAFAAAAAERVWGRPFDADDLRSIRRMKARTEAEIERRGLTGRELKRGPGGIRDVEFSIQLLQLVHGRQDRALRVPATLDALAELAGAGYVALEDATALDAAYRFLRLVEHRLQLRDDQQVHAVPADDGARARLARVLGWRDDRDGTALGRFEAELVRHQATVRGIHERLFFRPMLEAFTGPMADDQGSSSLSRQALHDRLAAFGFTDAERTRAALVELTRGLTRSSRLMHQLLPLLLGWLSESPDPDLGLLGLRTLATGPHRSARLVESFRESTEVARRLCLLLGTSRLLTEGFEHHPDLIGALAKDADLASPLGARLFDGARAAMSWRTEDERGGALLRLKQTERTRIAAADVLFSEHGANEAARGPGPGRQTVVTPKDTAQRLTDLAEAVLEAALVLINPSVPMAVIALGRMGGRELGYASDLDVVLVHGGRGAADQALAEASATRLLHLVNGSTPARRIWPLDLDLRPEGRQGRLTLSIEGWRTYHERWAETWERQVLVRARPVAGDPTVAAAFAELVEDVVWRAPFTDDHSRDVRRMKARVERERIPAGEDPEFHLKLGRGGLADVEWTVQLLQLQHRVRNPSTLAAIDGLVAKGVLQAADATVLAESWRFCEHTRNRWYLVKGSRGDALPHAPEQLGRLARSLGTTGPALRDQHKRVTRRARAVVERVFYHLP